MGDDHFVYTYKDIFFIMKNTLQVSFDEQIKHLEESLTAKNNQPFKLHSNKRATISKLFYKFRSKWLQASRNLKTFLHQHESWLNSSIYLPVHLLYIFKICNSKIFYLHLPWWKKFSNFFALLKRIS